MQDQNEELKSVIHIIEELRHANSNGVEPIAENIALLYKRKEELEKEAFSNKRLRDYEKRTSLHRRMSPGEYIAYLMLTFSVVYFVYAIFN